MAKANKDITDERKPIGLRMPGRRAGYASHLRYDHDCAKKKRKINSLITHDAGMKNCKEQRRERVLAGWLEEQPGHTRVDTY